VNLFQLVALLLTLTAAFAYVNARFTRLPTTIGVMAISLIISLGLIALHALGYPAGRIEHALRSINFDTTLLQGMLSFLLFAGALHIKLDELNKHRLMIGTLATAGVVASTFLIGMATYGLLGVLGLGMPLVHCLLFGAIISPTDPIAVLGILRKAGAPRDLEIEIAGESLFNDGVAVVVFLILLEIATGHEVTPREIAETFAREALGGALFGVAIGLVGYYLLRSIDNYQVEVLITLALVTGGYALAMPLEVSGPIAIVVAGLLIGNQGRQDAMSDRTRQHVDMFWELIDEILNAVLFVLIGFEVLVVDLTVWLGVAIAGSVVIALAARLLCVGVPVAIAGRFRSFNRPAVWIMTWGGLRGGISVALALSLPQSPERDVILAITYGVVVFSILVQGLTIGRVVARTRAAPAPATT